MTDATTTPEAEEAAPVAQRGGRVVVTLDVDDGSWILADCGVTRVLARLVVRTDEQAKAISSAYDNGTPLPDWLIVDPLYEIQPTETPTDDGGSLSGIQALPHLLLGVGAPTRIRPSAVTFVSDLAEPDRAIMRGIVVAVEAYKTRLRAARSGIVWAPRATSAKGVRSR